MFQHCIGILFLYKFNVFFNFTLLAVQDYDDVIFGNDTGSLFNLLPWLILSHIFHEENLFQ